MNPNAQGLYRYIEKDVARIIRQRSKFGCVYCRSAIYTYEHFDPPFVDASKHDPDGMCLLCGTCQNKSTSGRLSKQTIKNRYKKTQVDASIRPPFDSFDFSSAVPVILLGSARFEGCANLISINGKSILRLDRSEDGASFPSISGFFCDEDKSEILRIEQNEWIGSCDVWDMKIVGTLLTIRRKKGDISLALRLSPPSTIIIEKLNMRHDDFHVLFEKDFFMIGHALADRELYVGFKRFTSIGAEVGIELQSCGPLAPEFQHFTMNGGEGVIAHGTGITLGKLSGVMRCLGLRIEKTTNEKTEVIEYDLAADCDGLYTATKAKFRNKSNK